MTPRVTLSEKTKPRTPAASCSRNTMVRQRENCGGAGGKRRQSITALGRSFPGPQGGLGGHRPLLPDTPATPHIHSEGSCLWDAVLGWSPSGFPGPSSTGRRGQHRPWGQQGTKETERFQEGEAQGGGARAFPGGRP